MIVFDDDELFGYMAMEELVKKAEREALEQQALAELRRKEMQEKNKGCRAMENLKPCPFCGETESLWTSRGTRGDTSLARFAAQIAAPA